MSDPLNRYYLSEMITDVGTADQKEFVVPCAGFLRAVETVLGAAITVADDTITVSRNGSALSPTITITQSGSAAGDYDSAEFNVGVAQGDRISVANSGASTGPAKLGITITLSK